MILATYCYMNSAQKVVFNTVVLYVKILLVMAISLITVPQVLRALGASDYGLYNLVAGVVGMLSFLNASLSLSSQRYMSVAMGAGDAERIEIIYNTSFFLHLVLGIVVVFIFECGAFFIGLLNIEPERLFAAQIIYQFLVFSTFIRIASVPFDAIMNAHEDLFPFAVIELIDSVLMLVIASTLKMVTCDRLLFYGFCLCLISLLTVFLKYIWCHHSYKKYRIKLFRNRNSLKSKEMFNFAGWNLFGGVAIIGRNQGVAIIINLFFGTVANAAYGIANQVNNALSRFSVTFQKAINPQLMKSEGMNNRDRLLRISYISSKYSVLALAFFAVPLIIEMPDVLSVWIKKEIPLYTLELSRYILLMTLVYQYSVGIMSAIQAVGNIKNYQITMGCIVLLNVPMAYMVIKAGFPLYYVTIGFVLLEAISLVVRVFMAKQLVDMPPSQFINRVVTPTLIVIGISLVFSYVPHIMLDNMWSRLIITTFVFCSIFLLLTWIVALDKSQKNAIINRIKTWKIR